MDTNVLVALLTEDALTDRADAVLANTRDVLIVSDFVAAELASVLARRVRSREMTAMRARESLFGFDGRVEREAQREEIRPSDVAMAAAFIRRLDIAVRLPHAISIAIARRVGADLVTFDDQMARAARKLGVAARRR